MVVKPKVPKNNLTQYYIKQIKNTVKSRINI